MANTQQTDLDAPPLYTECRTDEHHIGDVRLKGDYNYKQRLLSNSARLVMVDPTSKT
jgi:hypothetical protein